jgi:hypothetical protein
MEKLGQGKPAVSKISIELFSPNRIYDGKVKTVPRDDG